MDEVFKKVRVFARNDWIYYYYSKVRTTIQKYMENVFEATQIVDNLWLGSIESSCNREALHSRNIEMVISALLGCTAPYPYDFDYERAKLKDTEDENIIDEFRRLVPIIHTELLNKRGVLVHCFYGRSRSASITAAYLIKYYNMTSEEAVEYIKSKRSQVNPNPNYLKQLKEYEEEVMKLKKE